MATLVWNGKRQAEEPGTRLGELMQVNRSLSHVTCNGLVIDDPNYPLQAGFEYELYFSARGESAKRARREWPKS